MKNLFSKTLLLSALLIAFITVTASAADIETGTAVVDVGGEGYVLYFRSEPSTTSTVLERLPHGTVLPVFGKTDYWYKVVYNNQVGYVNSTYILFTPHDLVVSYVGHNGTLFDCETGGTKVYRCQTCSYVASEEISPGDHQKAFEMSISTSCTEDSYSGWYCTVCDWEDFEYTPAPGHDLFIDYAPLPGQVLDCEHYRFKVTYCLRESCGYDHRELVSPGHDYHEVSRIEPTRSSSGTSTMECSYCGDRDYITLPALPDTGMSDDFFFAGSNLLDWRLEIIRDLRPRFQLHLWRYVDRHGIGRYLFVGAPYAFRVWRT